MLEHYSLKKLPYIAFETIGHHLRLGFDVNIIAREKDELPKKMADYLYRNLQALGMDNLQCSPSPPCGLHERNSIKRKPLESMVKIMFPDISPETLQYYINDSKASKNVQYALHVYRIGPLGMDKEDATLPVYGQSVVRIGKYLMSKLAQQEQLIGLDAALEQTVTITPRNVPLEEYQNKITEKELYAAINKAVFDGGVPPDKLKACADMVYASLVQYEPPAMFVIEDALYAAAHVDGAVAQNTAKLLIEDIENMIARRSPPREGFRYE